MTEELKILERADSVPKGITPDGKMWRALLIHNTALYEVCRVKLDDFDREIPDRRASLPVGLDMHFTSFHRAQAALTRFVNSVWDMSDEVQAKSNRKAAKRDAA